MCTFTQILRSSLWLVGACLPVSLFPATLEVQMADLSGDYEDGGTTVEASSEAPTFEPSLAAMLRLEFDAKLARFRHEETSRVRVKFSSGALAIEIHDTDGLVCWSGAWNEGTGYVRDGQRVVLRFQTGTTEVEDVYLILEPVAENRLLQLTVRRVVPTLLGPRVQQAGIYLFARMP